MCNDGNLIIKHIHEYDFLDENNPCCQKFFVHSLDKRKSEKYLEKMISCLLSVPVGLRLFRDINGNSRGIGTLILMKKSLTKISKHIYNDMFSQSGYSLPCGNKFPIKIQLDKNSKELIITNNLSLKSGDHKSNQLPLPLKLHDSQDNTLIDEVKKLSCKVDELTLTVKNNTKSIKGNKGRVDKLETELPTLVGKEVGNQLKSGLDEFKQWMLSNIKVKPPPSNNQPMSTDL